MSEHGYLDHNFTWLGLRIKSTWLVLESDRGWDWNALFLQSHVTLMDTILTSLPLEVTYSLHVIIGQSLQKQMCLKWELVS